MQAYEELIVKGIRGLPQDALAQVADFVYFLRQKTWHPEVIADAEYVAVVQLERGQAQKTEWQHLEVEFADYEQKHPTR